MFVYRLCIFFISNFLCLHEWKTVMNLTGVCSSSQGRSHVAGEGTGEGFEGEARGHRSVCRRWRSAERSGGGLTSSSVGWCSHHCHGNYGSTQSECSHECWKAGNSARHYQVLTWLPRVPTSPPSFVAKPDIWFFSSVLRPHSDWLVSLLRPWSWWMNTQLSLKSSQTKKLWKLLNDL